MAGALEVHASALKDSLIDGMSFGSRPTASYIINRRSVSFPPQSGGVFEPNVLRLIRFSIADSVDNSSGWIDGDMLRLAFVIHNKTTGAIYFEPDLPCCLFRRLRVLAGGVEVHDIQDYGRVCQMFSLLQPAARRANDVAEGFGSSTKVEAGNPELVSSLSQPTRALRIPAGSSRRVVTQLLAPIFSAQRFLPTSFMGNLTIELELDNYDACFARDNERYPYAWEIVQPLILVD
jgi:hypothetical protein